MIFNEYIFFTLIKKLNDFIKPTLESRLTFVENLNIQTYVDNLKKKCILYLFRIKLK